MSGKRQTKKLPVSARSLTTVREHFPNVESVEDAKQDVTIKVTARDIAWAAKKNHNHCALARACEQHIGVDAAIVSRATAYLICGSKATRYHMSGAAAREVVAFDRGAGFTPGEYILKAPTPTMRMGARPGRPRGNVGKVPRKRRQYTFAAGIRSTLNGVSK